jgi:hypothetical protein
MRFSHSLFTSAAFVFAVSFAMADHNATAAPVVQDSLCVKYTKAVFGEDNADNELALMEAVVNLAVLGDGELQVPGILAPEGGLAPFFTGEAGATANRGDMPVAINFLDGAGDLPTPDPSSNTFILLSHLYQFFGGLLGCTAEGFPAYQGDPDMMRVHKFMNLDEMQLNFFNTQVALATEALGVEVGDVVVIRTVLDSLFNVRCTPPLTAESGVPDFLIGTQPGICTALSCPVADPASCPESNDSNSSVMMTSSPNQAPIGNETEVPDSLCVKYTIAVFGNDTAENELALMEALVNLAVLGDEELQVPGILAPEGGLAPFFTGEAGATANRGDMPVAINFLDGAGDLPTPDPSSNTFILLSHLYQFFGGLLGCTAEGFPAYQGDPDMMRVHKFMNLDEMQLDFFNTQVALAAQALGVEEDDVATIGLVLDSLFNVRCTPPLTAESGVPAFMIGTQSGICLASSCPVADPASCPETNPSNSSVMMTSSPNQAPIGNETEVPDSLCVKYTIAVFGNDTAENELALMEALVNLAVLGDEELQVPGILAPEGGLAPFFTGEAGATANRGDMPVAINFLDGAGDLPTPDPSSNTFILLSHLYQFFGGLLGCTAEGFPAYQGDPDMMRVHKFMNLDEMQLDFFNTQVALAAQALGVEEDDVATIGLVLDSLFNVRCTPPLTAESGVPAFMIGTQPGICTALSCPVADPPACPPEEVINGPTESPSALGSTDLSGAFPMLSVGSVFAAIRMAIVGAFLPW